MSTTDFNFCSEQMKLFLRDFLQDIRLLICQIKTNAYKIANIEPFDGAQQNIKIHSNFNSILKNCTQTSDDLKRVNALLYGCALNKENNFKNIQSKSPSINNTKNHIKTPQTHYNNITFQNCLANSIISSSKTDELVYEGWTLNQQNDVNKLNKHNVNNKNHWRNRTETQLDKVASDKEPTDVQSIGECFTKRTNFSSMKRKKCPQMCFQSDANSVNQISHFSIKKQPRMKTEGQTDSIDITINNHKQLNRDQSLFFTFNRIQKMEESSILGESRCPKITEETAKRNSQCLQIIRSIRKELSR